MNIDELEKLARAALDPTFPWPDRDAMRQGLWRAVELDFIEKSTPAAILELINSNKTLLISLKSAANYIDTLGGSSLGIRQSIARANGESNE